MTEKKHRAVVEDVRRETEGRIVKSFELAREIILATPSEEVDLSLIRTEDGRLDSHLSINYPVPPTTPYSEHEVLSNITLTVPVNHDETNLYIEIGVDDWSLVVTHSRYVPMMHSLVMGVDQSNPRAYGSGRMGEVAGSILSNVEYHLGKKLRDLQQAQATAAVAQTDSPARRRWFSKRG